MLVVFLFSVPSLPSWHCESCCSAPKVPSHLRTPSRVKTEQLVSVSKATPRIHQCQQTHHGGPSQHRYHGDLMCRHLLRLACLLLCDLACVPAHELVDCRPEQCLVLVDEVLVDLRQEHGRPHHQVRSQIRETSHQVPSSHHWPNYHQRHWRRCCRCGCTWHQDQHLQAHALRLRLEIQSFERCLQHCLAFLGRQGNRRRSSVDSVLLRQSPLNRRRRRCPLQPAQRVDVYLLAVNDDHRHLCLLARPLSTSPKPVSTLEAVPLQASSPPMAAHKGATG